MDISTLGIQEIVSAFMVLFAVIDITGSVPIIIDIQNKHHKLNAAKAALFSFLILFGFLFVGDALLGLFSVDISSFAVAGALIIFVLAVEMIFGIEIFKNRRADRCRGDRSPGFPSYCRSWNLNDPVSLKSGISYRQYYYRLNTEHHCRLLGDKECFFSRKNIRQGRSIHPEKILRNHFVGHLCKIIYQ